jgi:hypothetical protein
MNKMTPQKPTIAVSLLSGVSQRDIAELLYGMEEEGIPFALSEPTVSAVVEQAYRAASDSPLSVGIAVDNRQIVVHYKNLPADSPLFVLTDYWQQKREILRAVGCNAARLVKGLPFKAV